jgi:RND family efflux transporter MFP subunit
MTDEEIEKAISEYQAEIDELNTKIVSLKEKQGKPATDEADATTEKATIVSVKNITEEKFEHIFEISGSVEAIKSAFISPEINGQIIRVHVFEGQRVIQGQLLASLNSNVMKNNIAELETSLQLANTVYKKQKYLWDQKIGSEVQFLEAKNNKESLEAKLKTLKSQLDLTFVKAPFNGIIDEVYQKEGEMATPGVQLLQLVNLNKLYINADVSETYLPKISKNDIVTVEFPTFPDLQMKAAISRTTNVINPQNRTFNIQIKLDNKNEQLKPNIIAIVKITDFSSDAAIVVPSIIIKQDSNGSYLYIAKEENGTTVAKKVYVTTGLSYNDNTIIEKGLKVGDKAIAAGYNLITEKEKIQISETK